MHPLGVRPWRRKEHCRSAAAADNPSQGLCGGPRRGAAGGAAGGADEGGEGQRRGRDHARPAPVHGPPVPRCAPQGKTVGRCALASGWALGYDKRSNAGAGRAHVQPTDLTESSGLSCACAGPAGVARLVIQRPAVLAQLVGALSKCLALDRASAHMLLHTRCVGCKCCCTCCCTPGAGCTIYVPTAQLGCYPCHRAP